MKTRPIEIGYWHDGWLSQLPRPQEFVDTNWNIFERERVAAYLESGKRHMAWRGYSSCRFGCGVASHQMGSRDLTDGVYVWPEGYAHYIRSHGVKPPAEFIAHVLSRSVSR